MRKKSNYQGIKRFTGFLECFLIATSAISPKGVKISLNTCSLTTKPLCYKRNNRNIMKKLNNLEIKILYLFADETDMNLSEILRIRKSQFLLSMMMNSSELNSISKND
jgi:hypothetical protein